jgi:hypothetical protein
VAQFKSIEGQSMSIYTVEMGSSHSFAYDFVKAAIAEIPDYRTVLGGSWSGVTIDTSPAAPVMEVTLHFLTRNRTQARAKGLINCGQEWDSAIFEIQIKNSPMRWTIEGKVNNEGSFEFGQSRRLSS